MMHGQTESIFRERPIEALAQGEAGHAPLIQHAHSMAPVRVEVPPLPTGGHFLEIWPVREWPEQGVWERDAYESYAPPLFVLNDVLVHGSAGILCVGDAVVAESLAHTSPDRHGYRALARGVALAVGAAPRRVSGVHISVLAAAEGDYAHAMLDGLARLAAVPDNYVAAAESLLVPEGGAYQSEVLDYLDLPPSIAVQRVGRQESLRVETLVLPLSVSGEAAFHPCLLEFFRRVSANVPPTARRLPRRFAMDTAGADRRGLLNAAEVHQALARQGFEIVRLDVLSLADQICLFRQAEAIVTVQGAGLANLGYARPGCVVVELMPDSLVDWRCRNLAALAHLHYDCVLGRARKPWRPLSDAGGQTLWDISVQHVAAAVAQAIGGAALAA